MASEGEPRTWFSRYFRFLLVMCGTNTYSLSFCDIIRLKTFTFWKHLWELQFILHIIALYSIVMLAPFIDLVLLISQ